jgi:hypothetical protein
MKFRTRPTTDKGSNNNSLTHLGLYPLLSLQSRWTSHLLAYQKSTLRKGYKQQKKRTLKIMRAIRQRQPRTQILIQNTTRLQIRESSTVIPPSPPPIQEETLTIRLVFPGHELPNQDFVTPIMATIRQLKQRIKALLEPTSSNHPANDHFITTTGYTSDPSVQRGLHLTVLDR